MAFVVPSTIEIEVLTDVFADAMTLRVYGNNVTPDGNSVTSAFTEVVGGGYANKPLTTVNWTLVKGDPSYAIYKETQVWTFTGALDAPNTIYGYYVTRNSDGKLMWAERFPPATVPFSPIAGSVIKVLPKFTCQSAF